MIYLSDREVATLIDALGLARDISATLKHRASSHDINDVLEKITSRMTPATFGLYVATEGEVAVADQLQSAASRLAEYVGSVGDAVPYGVFEAALEAQSASAQWTAVRRG